MENKTPFEKQNELNTQLKILDDNYRVKFFQLKQNYLPQRKVLFEKYNN